jgi:hypothetical protein
MEAFTPQVREFVDRELRTLFTPPSPIQWVLCLAVSHVRRLLESSVSLTASMKRLTQEEQTAVCKLVENRMEGMESDVLNVVRDRCLES